MELNSSSSRRPRALRRNCSRQHGASQVALEAPVRDPVGRRPMNALSLGAGSSPSSASRLGRTSSGPAPEQSRRGSAARSRWPPQAGRRQPHSGATSATPGPSIAPSAQALAKKQSPVSLTPPQHARDPPSPARESVVAD
ncbi:MAG: hypothetical protein ACLTDR_14675 [Adlercreutzia equolifaciens]